MKRALGLTFIIAACVVGFLSIRGTMPFMPIFGVSMEPTLQSGSLLMIEPIDAQDVKVGDIIIYNVPPMVREYYNYPPVVAHRVIEVKKIPSLGFRTAGDNTGEDPFTIRSQDLRGTVGDQIPHLGLPLLFFQSQQGMIFVIIALFLLALFLYGSELSHGGSALHRRLFAPVISEEKRTNRVLTNKIDATEQRMNSTEKALNNFAAAIELYAHHLSSHTSAIQGLSEASQELKRGAADQNRVLKHLMETMEQTESRKEDIVPGAEPAVPQWAKPVYEVTKQAREAAKPEPEAAKPAHEVAKPEPEVAKPVTEPVTELEKLALEREKAAHELEKLMLKKERPAPKAKKPALELDEPLPKAGKKQSTPGCARKRQPLTDW
jgi:signal peptidase